MLDISTKCRQLEFVAQFLTGSKLSFKQKAKNCTSRHNIRLFLNDQFGPLLFLLYINDIVNDIGAKISFFADDISLSINVENPVMVAACLNTDLLKLSHCVATLLVMFNPTKTKSRIFSRKLNKPLHPPLFMENQQIVEVESHKHLGVILSAVCTYSQGARFLKIDLRVKLAPLNLFKPSSKLFY